MPLKTFNSAVTILAVFRERQALSEVLNAPNQSAAAADNLTIPHGKTAATFEAYAQRNSQLLQLLTRQPTANKIKTQQVSSHTASPKEKCISSKTRKQKKGDLREISPRCRECKSHPPHLIAPANV